MLGEYAGKPLRVDLTRVGAVENRQTYGSNTQRSVSGVGHQIL